MKKSLRDHVNGNTGIVISSSAVLITIAVITLLLNMTNRLDAKMNDIAEKCIEKKLETVSPAIEKIKIDITKQGKDIDWIKEILLEIKNELKSKENNK